MSDKYRLYTNNRYIYVDTQYHFSTVKYCWNRIFPLKLTIHNLKGCCPRNSLTYMLYHIFTSCIKKPIDKSEKPRFHNVCTWSALIKKTLFVNLCEVQDKSALLRIGYFRLFVDVR